MVSLASRVGKKKEIIPTPTVAPQTGAPKPQTWRAPNPIAVATKPKKDPREARLRITLSFIFLTKHIVLKLKRNKNKKARRAVKE